jgi:hypothetical protein
VQMILALKVVNLINDDNCALIIVI